MTQDDSMTAALIGDVTVYFHTGGPVSIGLKPGDTLTLLRKELEVKFERQTSGLVAIVDGIQVPQDAEDETEVPAGASVVFSGEVKGA